MTLVDLRDFPRGEREDFFHACERQGRLAQEFEVTAEVDASSGRPSRTVLVRHAPSRHRLSYQADESADWIAAFEQSLRKGDFPAARY